MLVLDKLIRDSNITSSLIQLIDDHSISDTSILPEPFYSYNLLNQINKDYKIWFNDKYTCVGLYFPTAFKKQGSKLIETSVVILYDLYTDTEDDESLTKTLNKYSIDWSRDFWYEAFINAISFFAKNKTFTNWELPERPEETLSNEDKDNDDIDDDDVDSFLNSFEDNIDDTDIMDDLDENDGYDCP